jgi:hypothetical protein
MYFYTAPKFFETGWLKFLLIRVSNNAKEREIQRATGKLPPPPASLLLYTKIRSVHCRQGRNGKEWRAGQYRRAQGEVGMRAIGGGGEGARMEQLRAHS